MSVGARGDEARMWIGLLIIHALAAVLLLGAITHQAVSVWAPLRTKPSHFVDRARSVRAASYVNAIIALYVFTAVLGGWIYTLYRISARLTLERGGFWWTFGAFELKEHFVALGLAVLPAYWCYWKLPGDEHARTRALLTTLIALIVWWGFIVGHLTNNVRGLGT
jgi:hypothetical protein